jgi:sec-independent protein translocase protein TatB
MFGLGIWEVLAILLVAIVFINPKDLPKIARKVGYWYGKMREMGKWISDPARELEAEIRKPMNDLDEIANPVQEIEEEIKSELNDLNIQPGKDYWKGGVPDLNGIMPSASKPEVEKQDNDNQETT